MKRDLGLPIAHRLGEERGLHSACFSVGAVSVEVTGECLDDVALGPSLRLFGVQTERPTIRIAVERTEKLGATRGRQLFDSGSVWRMYEDESGFRFEFSTPVCSVQPYKRLHVDEGFRRATIQMREECGDGLLAAPLDYPLDELLIMHRLTQEKAIELHGCGIVRNGIGNLFVGHSGAGKSTTTRLWTTREDVEVLSDDRIIVRREAERPHKDTSVVRTPCGAAGCAGQHGVPSTSSGQALRRSDRSASPTVHSAQDDREKRMRMYGTPWHGEAMYASPGSAPVGRIFVLEHGHGNLLTQLSPSQAAAELFARAFVPFHRHEYVESALQFLEEIVESVPCYRFAFEPNQSAVERILEFRD